MYPCREVRSPNECTEYDIKLSNSEATTWRFGNGDYPFLTTIPISTLTGVVASDMVLSMGQIVQTMHATDDWC